MAAAVGREKQARRILIGAVAGEVARLGVAEPDEVEAGDGVGEDGCPLLAAVLRDQDDAAGAAAGQLLAAGDPDHQVRQRVQRAQRGAGAGRLAFPGLAAVDGLPDDALVADGPADLGVDELHGPQGGVLVVAGVGGPRRQRQGGAGREGQQIGSHRPSPLVP